MSANGLRSALAEFGIVAAQGLKGLRSLMELLADPASAVPMRRSCRCGCWRGNGKRLQTRISASWKTEIVRAAKADEVARRLMAIPGLGPIGATAILSVPDARVFKSARDFAAWLGFTPRQFGTGGKQRSGSISKQGNRTLRTLLTVGATAPAGERVRDIKDPWPSTPCWRGVHSRSRVVAYAAKMSRIIRAMLVTGEHYRAP